MCDGEHTTFDGHIKAEKLTHRDIIHAVLKAGAQEEPMTCELFQLSFYKKQHTSSAQLVDFFESQDDSSVKQMISRIIKEDNSQASSIGLSW